MSNFVLTPNAVAKLRRAIAPRSGNTGAVAASGRPIDPDRFPPPFTVRWSASAASGAGAWVIWLPAASDLLLVDGESVTIGGVSAAQELPGGWYTIDDITSDSSAVYLVITVYENSGAATAELSQTEGQATTGEKVYNVKIADIATSEMGAKSVKQYTESVVTFSEGKPGAAGADASITVTQEPVEPTTDRPGGGVQLTFQPKKGGQDDGNPEVVTLWNGSGGTDLSDTAALDVVPSTEDASAGVAVTASRQDHVHKMPATVDLLNLAQTITAQKTFSNGSSGLRFESLSSGYFTIRAFQLSPDFSIYAGSDATTGRILLAAGTYIVLGAPSASGSYPNVRVGLSPTDDPSAANLTSVVGTKVATLKWVDDYYQRKLSNVVTSVNGSTTRADDASGNDIVADPTTGAVILKVNSAKVDLLNLAQTITAQKTFSKESNGLKFESAGGVNFTVRSYTNESGFAIYAGNYDMILLAQGGYIVLGGSSASSSFPSVRLGVSPAENPANVTLATATAGLKVATLRWTDSYYQRKSTTKIRYIAAVKWDTSDHKLKQQIIEYDFATGQKQIVSAFDDAYNASGAWVDVVNGSTTGISSILSEEST